MPEPDTTIGPDEVRAIAHLARLALAEDEVPGLVDHFRRMLRFVEHLEEADDPAEEPWSLAPAPLAVLREDRVRAPAEPGAPMTADAWRRNAPESEGDHFTVPRVVG